MNLTLLSPRPTSRALGGRARFPVLQSVGVAALILASSSALVAQDNRERRTERGGDRGNFNPQEMQTRMLSSLRERLDIKNDDEWTVISDLVTKVAEARRASGGAVGGMALAGRGGPQGGDTSRGGPRGRTGGNVEVAALQAAINDKLPDAEIKARLDRMREVRKDNEAKLVKAQEELRAVLSVRQEAILVMYGLLP